jgi:hypothetical protein
MASAGLVDLQDRQNFGSGDLHFLTPFSIPVRVKYSAIKD